MALTAQQLQDANTQFYQAAVARSVKIAPITNLTSGSVVTIQMPKAGYGRGVMLTFVGTLNRTEGATTGTVNASPSGPWNVFQGITFTDYAGITRLSNVPGTVLANRRRLAGANRLADTFTLPGSEGSTGNLPLAATQFNAFSIPAATASSTTTSTLVAQIWVPFSAHRRSVQGSFAFTVPDGSSNLSFTISPQVNQVASGATPDPFNIVKIPYTASATTSVTVSGTVYATYYYYDAPQGTPAPLGDISQVYELVYVRDQTNLSAGNIKSFVLQTGRTYLRVWQNLVLNGVLSQTTNLSEVAFVIDSATPTLDEDIYAYEGRTLDDYGQAVADGWLVWDFTRKPWTPDSYGSLSTNLYIPAAATVGAVAYLDTTRECLYVSAQSPNLVQAGAAG